MTGGRDADEVEQQRDGDPGPVLAGRAADDRGQPVGLEQGPGDVGQLRRPRVEHVAVHARQARMRRRDRRRAAGGSCSGPMPDPANTFGDRSSSSGQRRSMTWRRPSATSSAWACRGSDVSSSDRSSVRHRVRRPPARRVAADVAQVARPLEREVTGGVAGGHRRQGIGEARQAGWPTAGRDIRPCRDMTYGPVARIASADLRYGPSNGPPTYGPIRRRVDLPAGCWAAAEPVTLSSGGPFSIPGLACPDHLRSRAVDFVGAM